MIQHPVCLDGARLYADLWAGYLAVQFSEFVRQPVSEREQVLDWYGEAVETYLHHCEEEKHAEHV